MQVLCDSGLRRYLYHGANPLILSSTFLLSATESKQDIKSLVEDRNVDNNTVLHLAAGTNDLSTAQVCLGYGADINALKTNNETPLYVATVKGNLQMVQLLVEKGADINAKNADSKSVLHR